MPNLEMDRFQELRSDPGSEEWNYRNEWRRKHSKVEGLQSRALRDAQSAIAKDIKAVKRDLSRETDPAKLENLMIHKEALEKLQGRMRQSNTVDGRKVYNSVETRLEAYGLYVMSFKGRMMRDMARNGPKLKGARITGEITTNVMFQRLRKRYEDDEEIDFKWLDNDVWIPGLEDLYDELDTAVRNYDSDQARSVIRRIHRLVNQYNEYHDTRGTVDLDRYDETGQDY